VLALLANFFWPITPVFKGQGAEVLIPFVFLALGIGLWVMYATDLTWPKSTKIFLALVLVYWCYARILDSIQNDAANYAAFILPIVICMIYLKPISTKTTFFTLDGLSVLIILISIIAQIAIKLDLVIPRTEFPHRLPLFPMLGFDSRWEGVFGNVNYSGPVGAFLIVYGLGRGKLRTIIFTASGLVFLLASESRGAMVAAFIGCLTIAIFKPTWGKWRLSLPVRMCIGGALVFIPLVASILSDPTGNGRLTVWNDFLSVWPKAPIFGVGEQQIVIYLQQGELSFFSTHGHNVFVQSLVTQGVIGFTLLITLVVMGVAITAKKASKGLSLGLALLITMVVCNLDEDLFSGNYLSIVYSSMILSVILVSSKISKHDESSV